jgi:hypothetical protein
MIQIIKEKPLKSTTNVKGILVRVTGGDWYALTKYQPPRNPWYGRAVKSTSTGRIDFNSNPVYVKKYDASPELEELKTLLINVLNGAESPQDRPIF